MHFTCSLTLSVNKRNDFARDFGLRNKGGTKKAQIRSNSPNLSVNKKSITICNLATYLTTLITRLLFVNQGLYSAFI